MLFFRNSLQFYKTRYSLMSMIHQEHTCQQNHSMKIAPLQVRPSTDMEKKQRKIRISEKRVSSWVFQTKQFPAGTKQCRLEYKIRGSLTLEAALVFPLFVFLCITFIIPMRIMDRQRQIQAVMEGAGEEISQYGYGAYLLEKGREEEADESRDEASAGSMEDIFWGISQAGIAGLILSRIDGDWIRDPSFSGTGIRGDMVQIRMTYRMPLPFSVFRIDSVQAQAVCSRRLWTGAEGNRGEISFSEGEEKEEMVYVGRSSTRYHRNRNCHYLFNDLRQVEAGEMEGLRNQEGKRYYPCPSCQAAVGEGPFFVMPWGTRYHRTGMCRAICAYVQTVPLSQVEHLGECSYCRGGN